MWQLLWLFGIVLLVLWVITPFMVFGLRSRVRRLEEAMQQGTTVPARASAPETRYKETQAAPETRTQPELGPSASEQLMAWLKEDWLLKTGGLFLLIGFGWLTTYAFMNNWIGPMGRISLGILAGTAILILGTWRIRGFVHQGAVFLVVGSTTILITVFAARQVYDFFTPATALGIMFLSSAYVALVSVRFKNKALSVASIILGGIAPLLTHSPSPDFTALYAYLLVIVLGTVWIVALTGQRELTAVSLILVTVYSIPQILDGDRDSTLLLFAYAFSAIFFVTNTVGILKLKDRNLVPDMIVAGGNGLFLLAWIMSNAPEEWQSLIISGWMLAFIAGAYSVFRASGKREPFYVYAGVSIAMLAAATAAELSGAALTIAFSIEAALISFGAYLMLEDKRLAERLCLLFIGPVLLSLESFGSSAWHQGVLHEDFFVLLVLAILLMGLGIFYSNAGGKQQRVSDINRTLLVVGSVYAFGLVWLSLKALMENDDLAVMASLLIYTVVGLISYFFGQTHGKKGLGVYGGVVLGAVIARLLLIDVWNMPLAPRFITFFAIGILLMSTAFFRNKKKVSSPAS